MSERWWIVAPLGHRQYDADHVPTEMMFMGEMVPVISTPAPPLDEWVCDWCSETIPLEYDVAGEPVARPLLVPVCSSSALCPGCMRATLKDQGLPDDAQAWSTLFCGCPPCKTALPMLREFAQGLR